MTNDIVERLNVNHRLSNDVICAMHDDDIYIFTVMQAERREAAAEIERLRHELRKRNLTIG
jgi:hypothetical protein